MSLIQTTESLITEAPAQWLQDIMDDMEDEIMTKTVELTDGCNYCRVSALYTLEDRDFTWCGNAECEAFFDISQLA